MYANPEACQCISSTAKAPPKHRQSTATDAGLTLLIGQDVLNKDHVAGEPRQDWRRFWEPKLIA